MPKEDEINPFDIVNTTFLECRENFRQFYMHAPQLTWRPSTEITRPLMYPSQWFTQNISHPVYDHFKQNAPSYLEQIKAQHHPDDGWVTWAKKGGYNCSVDVIARYAHLAINPLQHAFHDIRKKVPRETFDALDPSHLLILSMNYPLVQRYFTQRVDQITTPYQYYCDCRTAFQKTVMGTKGALANFGDHFGQLESGSQFGRVVVDMAEQTIAAKIGVALAVFGIYQLPSVKARTNASFNQLFQKNTVFGLSARSIPVRFIFSKPIARVHGNPVLSFAVISYLMTMSVARTIKDSLELEEQHPDIHKRLSTYNRDVVNAPIHLKYRQTLKNF